MTTDRRRVAVVGAGVAGLTAAYVLQRECDVTLYEAEPRLGGHAHTHDVATPDGRRRADRQRLHRAQPQHLPQPAAPVRRARGGDPAHRHEHVGALRRLRAGVRGGEGTRRDLRPVGQRRQPAVPPHARRGEALPPRRPPPARRATSEPLGPHGGALTLGDFLAAGNYTPYFRQHFMVPLVSCVWSCAPRTALLYPARSLFTFLDHHGALSVTGSPSWRTVVGGSRSYVERAAKELTATELSTPVRGVRRTATGVEIRDDADDLRAFDAAVVATHADDALGLLVDAHRRRAGDARRVLVVGQRDGAAHRRLGAPDPRSGAGLVELPPRPLRVGDRRGARQLRHEPAPPARRVARPRGHAQPRRPGRRRHRARPHAATRTPCTPRSRWPRRRRCRR